MLSLEDIKKQFVNLDRLYFYTIKPPRDLDELAYTLKSECITEYCKKRDMQEFHADCISQKGYRHYHGLIKLNTGDKLKNLSALQRYVNRNYGYFKIDPVILSIDSAYQYIMDSVHNSPSRTYTTATPSKGGAPPPFQGAPP